MLLDPNAPGSREMSRGIEDARRAIMRQITIVTATSDQELDGVFATIIRSRAGALLVGGGPFFLSQRKQLVALAARHALPASYVTRQYSEAGGLMSYGPSQTEAYRQAGAYAARILNGANPADLPVMQATKFELVINMKTARTLDLAIPPGVLAIADEVIE